MSEPDATGNGEAPRRRKPQRKLTDAEKATLREVLQRPEARVDGAIHIPTVEALTGLSYGQIYNFIRSDRYLHAQVGEADVGKLEATEADLIDADPPEGVKITNAQFEEYQAMIRQGKKMLQRDWVALGMTEEAGTRMEHYGKLGSAPTGMVLRVMGGQLISNLELLDRVIKADCERVLTGKLPKEVDGNGEPRDPEQVERDWRITVYKGMKLQLEMTSATHKSLAMMARVMADMRKMNGGQAPTAKGKFDMDVPAVPATSEREA